MTFAPTEWHVVVEAIARGDQVLTLRKGGVDDKPFAVAGSTFWLYPEWEGVVGVDDPGVRGGESFGAQVPLRRPRELLRVDAGGLAHAGVAEVAARAARRSGARAAAADGASRRARG